MGHKYHDGYKSRKLWASATATVIATGTFLYCIHKLVDGNQAALIPTMFTSFLGAIALYLATFSGTSVWEKLKGGIEPEVKPPEVKK